MQRKITRNTGNFTWEATVDLNVETADPVALYLLDNGIVREIQGAPSGGWEKAIAYPGKGVKRPAGFTRTDIPFTTENAEALRKALLGIEVEVGRNEKEEPILADLGISEVVVTEYSGPEASVPKFKAEKDFLRLYLFEADGSTPRKNSDGSERSIEGYIASPNHGNGEIEAPTEPWDEDVKFLAAVKALRAKQAAAKD